MNIYITDLITNESIQIPMMPEKISVAYENNFLSYDVLRVGEVKLPHGTRLTGVKWDGIFPGKSRKNMPYVKNWKKPKVFHSWLENARKSGAKLRVMITETPVNLDVYIASMSTDYAGGFGDIAYSLTLIEAKDINIETETPATPSSELPEEVPELVRPDIPRRKAANKSTYARKAGETLWDIAADQLGDGARWPEIYALNRELIGDDPTTEHPGQTYTLP